MLNMISMKLSTELLRRVDKARYSQDVYVYGIEIILSTFLEIVTILISSALVSTVEAGVIFIVVFSSLRIFTGGYHAKTYRKCFIVTVGSFWGAFLIVNIISNIFANEVLYFSLLPVGIYIIARAPILDENQPISNVKGVKNGKMAAITLMSQLILMNQFLQYNEKLMNMGIVTICLVAVYMLITDINKRYIDLRLAHAVLDAIKLINSRSDRVYHINMPSRIEKIPYQRILYIEREGKNSIITMTDGGRTYVRKSLTNVMKELDSEDFAYIDRGNIVNIKYIMKIKDGSVELENGVRLLASHAKLEQIKKKISEYWGEKI